MEKRQRSADIRTPLKVMDGKEGQRTNRVLGLIYDVGRRRFHEVYKDVKTGRICIEGEEGEASQEVTPSVSAA